MKKIAILYIGTGRYTIFWKEFFDSCERFFIPDTQKHYFFFTDSDELKSTDNVTIVKQDNLGWPLIACLRYKILNKLKEELKGFDYAFFFNGNMEFIRPITEEEFLPTQEDGYIVAPLHSGNKRMKSNLEFEYERNPKSTSYVPFGVGEKYFHSGLLGGRVKEFIELLDVCEKMTDDDLKNNIIPKFHDESVFNKYIIDKKYKELSNYYIFPVHGKYFYRFNKDIKIIQRDKSRFRYGGHDYLRGERDSKITPCEYFCRKTKSLIRQKFCK